MPEIKNIRKVLPSGPFDVPAATDFIKGENVGANFVIKYYDGGGVLGVLLKTITISGNQPEFEVAVT